MVATRRPRSVEKIDQKEMEYMRQANKLWIDTRLSEKEMNFLGQIMLESNKKPYNYELAGNISKSEEIIDKDNWFFKSALKKLTERMFYRDWDNFSKYHIEVGEKEEPLPEFELEALWVNYQKQYEFNPIHNHSGLFSFVVFMKIPTHWKEQHALPFSVDATLPSASDFQFVWTTKDSEVCTTTNFQLSSEDEGRMLFFPAYLRHQVYPFYGCEEERVTISGNICMPSIRASASRDSIYEEKKQNLKLLEKSVKAIKIELEMTKKADENVE